MNKKTSVLQTLVKLFALTGMLSGIAVLALSSYLIDHRPASADISRGFVVKTETHGAVFFVTKEEDWLNDGLSAYFGVCVVGGLLGCIGLVLRQRRSSRT